MKHKVSIEEAKEIAIKLKKKYNFGKPTCPIWFKNVSIPMDQDGNFGVSICIPSWSAVPQDESNAFFELFEGIHITMRVVAEPNINYRRKDESSKSEGKDATK